MSTLKALKEAQKPVAAPKLTARFSTDPLLYPIFTESERVMIGTLKTDARSYSCYAPEGWFDTLVEGERFVGAAALEGCLDPLDAVCDHWFVAIETGKAFHERAFLCDKAHMLAYSLEVRGHVTIPIANHYINSAMKSDIAVGLSLFRIKEVVEEFQKAFNENRPVRL